MIDIQLFWSYVTHWMINNKYTWKKLAEDCGMSLSTLNRKRGGGSSTTIEEFNCICQGIGLMPEFCLTNNAKYASPVLYRESDDHETTS